MKTVYVIGTCDTKQAELDYALERVRAAGAGGVLVDISTGSSGGQADVQRETVAASHPKGANHVLNQTVRGLAVAAMGEALAQYLVQRTDIGAVLGLGGSGNTSAVTAAMRALPVGVPKLMVSTLASGNVAPYVGPTDIAMMHAVADVAGLNAISRQVIANAAHAAAGMAMNQLPESGAGKPGVGLTMFGVTTPCVTEVRRRIEADFECFVFHATGTGGQCLEKLVDSGLLTAVIDITTTEVADHLFNGVLPCTDDRFGAMIRRRVPYLGSVGAVDMVNFGARETVSTKYQGRIFHIHNPQVTLMRTTADENQAIGDWIVQRINLMEGAVRFLLPLRGVSALDAPGQAFHDPAADAALFSAIRSGWRKRAKARLIEVDAHINDEAFATAVVEAFRDIT